MTETWRVIEWAPDYEISSHGRLMSYKRRAPKLLSPRVSDRLGHMSFTLSINGKRYDRQVHRLVAEAFIPNPDGKPFVAHNNGDPANNGTPNLRWATQPENLADRKSHGTSPDGEMNGRSKLSEREVVEIRQVYAAGSSTQAELGRRFGISQGVVSKIINGRRWSHVQPLAE